MFYKYAPPRDHTGQATGYRLAGSPVSCRQLEADAGTAPYATAELTHTILIAHYALLQGAATCRI